MNFYNLSKIKLLIKAYWKFKICFKYGLIKE